MNCPACNADIYDQPIAELHDAFYHANNGQLYYYFCDACEAVFHQEPITEEYYHEQYRTDLQKGNKGVVYKTVELQEKRAENLLPFLKMIKRDFAPQNALDVGASCGALVKAMIDLKIGAYGLDIDNIYSQYAFDHHHFVYLRWHEIAGASYDLFTCMHTLEHLLNPIQSLQLLRQVASDKAVFFCEVPNFAISPLAMSYPHRFAYTERSLYNTLLSGGWFPIWIIPYWGIHAGYRYPTNLLALCLSVPASRFDFTQQSARLGQTMARME